MHSSVSRLWDTHVVLDAALRSDDLEASVVASAASAAQALPATGATAKTAKTTEALAAVLEQPLAAAGYRPRPADRPVWQCTVHNDSREPALTDQRAATIARTLVAAAGLDRADGSAGCRWIAVRRGTEQVRIIATLIREDGTAPDLHQAASRVEAACQLLTSAVLSCRRPPGPPAGTPVPGSAPADRPTRHR